MRPQTDRNRRFADCAPTVVTALLLASASSRLAGRDLPPDALASGSNPAASSSTHHHSTDS